MNTKQADLFNRLEDLKKHQEEEENLLRVSLFIMATENNLRFIEFILDSKAQTTSSSDSRTDKNV